MAEFRERAQQLAATAQQIAQLRDAKAEAALLAEARARLIETGYDGYGDGTDLFTMILEVPIRTYAKSEGLRTKLESSILKRIQDITRTEAGLAVTQVVISPEIVEVELKSVQIADAEAPAVLPEFWAPGHFRLFISHVSRVKTSAHKLKAALAPFHIAAFVAHDDIEPTRKWEAEIDSALRTMDALSALLTPDVVQSKWCDQEVGIAIGRGKVVIPIRAGADPHGFLGKYQGVSLKGLDAASLADKLFGILIKHDQAGPRMADALIDRMAGINSWDGARKTMSLLEAAPRLNRGQVARLVATVEDNSEVKESHGVADRITALAARVGQSDAS